MVDAAAPFLIPLIAAVLAFAALWPVSVMRRDVSIVEVLWGPGFFVQLAIAAAVRGAPGPQGWLLLGLIGLWSARLAWVLLGRRRREGHEDPRYQSMRASWGPAFWWQSLFVVFCLQAFLQWLVVLGPMTGLQAGAAPLGWLSIVGALIALAGLALETVADRQLDQFKRTAGPNALMMTGLRAHVRHPNYLGEIVFWSGIALICVEAGAWLGLASPLLITLFLTRISGAPLLDERLSATRPDYAAYRARVPGFIPLASNRSRAAGDRRP
ncbi:MAG: DUF1295 domain-containing protein [Pseudomonadota bacterium]